MGENTTMSTYDKNRTNIYIPFELKKKAKKQGINLSKFFTEMLECELAGEFKQLKIDKLEQELASAKAENSQIQTQRQKQKERAEESCRRVEDEALERRRQNMPRRREDI